MLSNLMFPEGLGGISGEMHQRQLRENWLRKKYVQKETQEQ